MLKKQRKNSENTPPDKMFNALTMPVPPSSKLIIKALEVALYPIFL